MLGGRVERYWFVIKHLLAKPTQVVGVSVNGPVCVCVCVCVLELGFGEQVYLDAASHPGVTRGGKGTA